MCMLTMLSGRGCSFTAGSGMSRGSSRTCSGDNAFSYYNLQLLHSRSHGNRIMMDAFVSRKRRCISGPGEVKPSRSKHTAASTHIPAPTKTVAPESTAEEEESTDFKLALLASLHTDLSGEVLLEALLASDGSVEQASEALTQGCSKSPKKRPATSAIGYQSSLSSYRVGVSQNGGLSKRPLTRKGKTLYLYMPEDIEAHTPCSIIHNFLPIQQADALLLALLAETPTYSKLDFQLFERTVKSPHTFCFYVNSWDEAEEQKTQYIYDGRQVDVCPIPNSELSYTNHRLGRSPELT
jgi:hypothetical protein